jgi:hypothetical protein
MENASRVMALMMMNNVFPMENAQADMEGWMMMKLVNATRTAT